jgi:hypothetical protein
MDFSHTRQCPVMGAISVEDNKIEFNWTACSEVALLIHSRVTIAARQQCKWHGMARRASLSRHETLCHNP